MTPYALAKIQCPIMRKPFAYDLAPGASARLLATLHGTREPLVLSALWALGWIGLLIAMLEGATWAWPLSAQQAIVFTVVVALLAVAGCLTPIWLVMRTFDEALWVMPGVVGRRCVIRLHMEALENPFLARGVVRKGIPSALEKLHRGGISQLHLDSLLLGDETHRRFVIGQLNAVFAQRGLQWEAKDLGQMARPSQTVFWWLMYGAARWLRGRAPRVVWTTRKVNERGQTMWGAILLEQVAPGRLAVIDGDLADPVNDWAVTPNS